MNQSGQKVNTMVLDLAALIPAVGVFPQPGISSRQRAAEAILNPAPSSRS
jgi:hypothetical protein